MRRLLGASSAVALTWMFGMPAAAQVTNSVNPIGNAGAAPNSPSSGPGSPVIAADAGGATAAQTPAAGVTGGTAGDLNEIVVTARRREERIQDVPASVTSITASQTAAAGVTSTRELTVVVPGLYFRQAGSHGQPNIRGIGTTNVTPGDEPNVSTYVDGVYLTAGVSSLLALNNIERIEVVKGPQGTLFGRNSTGGAISIFTVDPTQDRRLNGHVEYGSFGRISGSGYVSGGITDDLAADIAVTAQKDHGYVRDINTNARLATARYLSGRSKWIYSPSDALRITAAVDAGSSNDLRGTSSTALNGNTRGNLPGTNIATTARHASLSLVPTNHVRTYGGYAKVQTFGNVNFMSITSARRTTLRSRTDSDASPLDLVGSYTRQRTNTYTQEFQLSGGSDSFQWVAGLFGIDDQSGALPILSGTALTPATRIYTDVETKGAAAFSEGTFKITPSFSVTAGLRYSWEKKTRETSLNFAPTVTSSKSWRDLTPRVVAQFIVPDTVNLYGSYSRGFKSGVFNAFSPTEAPVDPESVDAFEVGAKSLFSNRILLNAAAFHYSYKNIQILAFEPSGLSRLQNAAKATIYGAEATAAVSLPGGFTARLGATYTHGRYDDFPLAAVTIPRPLNQGNTTVVRDVSGNHIVRTPEWTGQAAFAYEHDFSFATIGASTNIYRSGAVFWDVGNRLRQPAYTVLAGEIHVKPSASHFKFSLVANNILNRQYAQVLLNSATADTINYAEPRYIGARIDFDIR